jgi:hypothetical protein
MCGIARNRIVSIMNRSADGSTNSPRPSHSLRPARSCDGSIAVDMDNSLHWRHCLNEYPEGV